MKLSALTPDTRNANKGTPRGRKLVKESLQRYGAGRSILLDRSGNIIAGNKTVEGAKAIGMNDLQVVKSDGSKLIAVQRTDLDINDKKARELAIADNRASELGLEWDVDVLKELEVEGVEMEPFWDERELVQFLARTSDEAPEPQLDKAAELQRKWDTKPGQLWLIGDHRLLCGDSTKEADVARLWGANSERPALMVTDPPYGVDYDPAWRDGRTGEFGAQARCGHAIANDDKADWRTAWNLFPGNVSYVWCASLHVHEVAESLLAAGFELRASIIWAKQHFAISQGHYHWKHEPCWYAVRKGQTAGWIGDRSQTTIWEISSLNPAGRQEERHAHGTQKPLECMLRPLHNHEGDVYDPFLGSGTTMAAAQLLKRRCYGIEIEPKYVAVTLQRLFDMGLQPVLDNA